MKFQIRIIFVLLFSAILSLALIYVNAPQDIYSTALLISISVLFSQLLFICRNILSSFVSDVLNKNALIDTFEQILYYKANGSSTSSSLQKVIQSSRLPEFKSVLMKALLEMKLGLSFSEAFNLKFEKVLHELQFSFLESERGPYSQITQFLSIYRDKKRQNSIASLDSLQRSSTLSMFITTILPSFILFSFIGAAIISQSQPSLFALSLVLLIGIPIAYAISGLSSMKRFFVETL